MPQFFFNFLQKKELHRAQKCETHEIYCLHVDIVYFIDKVILWNIWLFRRKTVFQCRLDSLRLSQQIRAFFLKRIQFAKWQKHFVNSDTSTRHLKVINFNLPVQSGRQFYSKETSTFLTLAASVWKLFPPAILEKKIPLQGKEISWIVTVLGMWIDATTPENRNIFFEIPASVSAICSSQWLYRSTWPSVAASLFSKSSSASIILAFSERIDHIEFFWFFFFFFWHQAQRSMVRLNETAIWVFGSFCSKNLIKIWHQVHYLLSSSSLFARHPARELHFSGLDDFLGGGGVIFFILHKGSFYPSFFPQTKLWGGGGGGQTTNFKKT